MNMAKQPSITHSRRYLGDNKETWYYVKDEPNWISSNYYEPLFCFEHPIKIYQGKVYGLSNHILRYSISTVNGIEFIIEYNSLHEHWTKDYVEGILMDLYLNTSYFGNKKKSFTEVKCFAGESIYVMEYLRSINATLMKLLLFTGTNELLPELIKQIRIYLIRLVLSAYPKRLTNRV